MAAPKAATPQMNNAPPASRKGLPEGHFFVRGRRHHPRPRGLILISTSARLQCDQRGPIWIYVYMNTSDGAFLSNHKTQCLSAACDRPECPARPLAGHETHARAILGQLCQGEASAFLSDPMRPRPKLVRPNDLRHYQKTGFPILL